MRISINAKALGAFKKLGAVALITATIFFVACKQTGNTGGESTPKHAITFGVEGGNGTIKAKVDGVDETSTSPINIEEGKTVTFTATANAGYRVKGWTLDGSAVNGTNTEYKLKVSKPATVSVSFEAIPKHAITFSVDGANGTLKAIVSDKEINSGDEVEEGKTVTFTATANDGYRVKGWTLDGNAVNGTAETYTLTVTQATTVSVSFELNPVEGGAVLILSPDELSIWVKAKTEDDSDITVEGCNETSLKSDGSTNLHAKGTTVILKGNIIELDCSESQLTALNVQGLTSLQKLECYTNKLTELNVQGLTTLWRLDCSNNQLTSLNMHGLTALKELYCVGNQIKAQAMTELLNALPARTAGDDAKAILYTEYTGEPEGNHKDFTQPAELKTAFDGAKKKNWKLQKMNASGKEVDI